MNKMLEPLKTWSGTAEQLVQWLRKIELELGVPESEVNPSERLIRYYVSLGILSRPRREGKEAIYGFEHLITYLVARTLARDGWPLAKVKEQIESLGEDDLYRYINLSSGTSTSAQSAKDLIAHYKANSGVRTSGVSRPFGRASGESNTSAGIVETNRHSADLTIKKLEEQATLVALGNLKGDAKQAEILEIELTAWCRLLIDPLQLSKLPPETPELLGKAVEHLLLREIHRHKGAYK